jgi:hypothetical protein
MDEFRITPPKKPFRAFVTNRYYENRDEYEGFGQKQPYTFSEYVWGNISQLMADYRLTRR